MISLQPLNEPPATPPTIRRTYPVAPDHFTPGRGGYTATLPVRRDAGRTPVGWTWPGCNGKRMRGCAFSMR
jgi:hypothetical protein